MCLRRNFGNAEAIFLEPECRFVTHELVHLVRNFGATRNVSSYAGERTICKLKSFLQLGGASPMLKDILEMNLLAETNSFMPFRRVMMLKAMLIIHQFKCLI
jgi:hypothetical protein